MNLITRCPACETLFKVVPDQLRISEGWVRCGHCSEIFDAYARMIPAGEANSVLAALAPNPPPARELAPEPPAPPSSALPAAVVALPVALAESHSAVSITELERELTALASPAAPAPATTPEPTPAKLAGPEPSFVRQARRQAFWRGAGVRTGLSLVALVLLAALSLQVALHHRDGLAAAEPRLKPWLTQLCEPLQCQIGHPKQIDSVVIDSSAFNRLGPDRFALRFTLRNKSSLELAAPAIELTLTDGQDRALLRRVFSAADMGGAPTLAGGSDWNASVNFAVDKGSNGGKRTESQSAIAGYRLLAFYP